MAANDGTAQGLVDFLKAAGERGSMNPGTAKAYVASIGTILSIEGEGWEQISVLSLDADEHWQRFAQLKHTDYTTDSLQTYRGRFTKGLDMYRQYLQNGYQFPKAAGPKVKLKQTRGDDTPDTKRRPRTDRGRTETPLAPSDGPVELVGYKFPIRPGLLVELRLPMDLTTDEAERLAAHVRTLAFESPKAIEPPRALQTTTTPQS